jgi:hypothetical protein
MKKPVPLITTLTHLVNQEGLPKILCTLGQVAWDKHLESSRVMGDNHERTQRWGAVAGALFVQCLRDLTLGTMDARHDDPWTWFSDTAQTIFDHAFMQTLAEKHGVKAKPAKK